MDKCLQCKKQIETTIQAENFYKKAAAQIGDKTFPIPNPQLCPACREQRRLAFYNRRQLYKRKCDLSGKSIISNISPDKPFKVYNVEEWYSDKWDPIKSGRKYDLNRPFFEQFRELMEDTPLLSLALLGNNENSEYNNDNSNLRNCYLTFDGDHGEDSMYGETFIYTENCMDFIHVEKSQLCYECVHCVNCYNVKFSSYSKDCSDSWFLKDCTGCRNCAGCTNLHQKQYYIFNKKYSKEDYEAFMAKFDSGSYKMLQETIQKMDEFNKTQPQRSFHGEQNDNVIGDNIKQCKNSFYCFDSNKLQDCSYMTGCQKGAKDSMDVSVWGNHMELTYNCAATGENVSNLTNCYLVYEGANNVHYSIYCSNNIKNLFGCIGLRQKEYCILNKQYTKKEYEELVPKIIEQMIKNGEWGEFFPPEISPFAYNETLAQDFYPLSEKKIKTNGWQWKEPEEKNLSADDAYKIPDNINDVPDDICDQVLTCEKLDKHYKITPTELAFYKRMKLPIPHLCPDHRHAERLKAKQANKLFERDCDKCGQPINTTLSPNNPGEIYCEKCYKKLKL